MRPMADEIILRVKVFEVMASYPRDDGIGALFPRQAVC